MKSEEIFLIRLKEFLCLVKIDEKWNDAIRSLERDYRQVLNFKLHDNVVDMFLMAEDFVCENFMKLLKALNKLSGEDKAYWLKMLTTWSFCTQKCYVKLTQNLKAQKAFKA